jgi:hypothetical protein
MSAEIQSSGLAQLGWVSSKESLATTSVMLGAVPVPMKDSGIGTLLLVVGTAVGGDPVEHPTVQAGLGAVSIAKVAVAEALPPGPLATTVKTWSPRARLLRLAEVEEQAVLTPSNVQAVEVTVPPPVSS